MTVPAGGCAGIAFLGRATMHTRAIAGGLGFVTGVTIDRFGGDIVIGMHRGDIGVTTGAGVGHVRGCGEFCGIHKQQDFLPDSVCPGQRFIRMTLQAIVVRNSSSRGEWQCDSQANSDQAPQARFVPDTHTMLTSQKSRGTTPRRLAIPARLLRHDCRLNAPGVKPLRK